jgi:quinoprotein glucose dehydrogenase
MLSIVAQDRVRAIPIHKLFPAAVLLSFAVVACSPSSENSAGTDTAAAPAGNFDFEGWDQYLGGADSSQFSSLKQIDKSNVGRLEVAWTYPTTENYLFNPLVVGNTMYVLAKGRSIVALDAATGQELWTHANEGPVGTRGMNYWRSEDGSDERLLYLNSGFLTAIDARTGETISTFGTDGRVDLRVGYEGDLERVRGQTNNPGRIFDDTIIISLPAGGAGYAATPADIHAYDVRTGSTRSSASSTYRRARRATTSMAATATARTCSATAWSRSTPAPASAYGTSRRFITICGITTYRRRQSC